MNKTVKSKQIILFLFFFLSILFACEKTSFEPEFQVKIIEGNCTILKKNSITYTAEVIGYYGKDIEYYWFVNSIEQAGEIEQTFTFTPQTSSEEKYEIKVVARAGVSKPEDVVFLKVTTYDKILKINNKIYLESKTGYEFDSTLKYEWTTNIGSINGTGRQIEYIAPNYPGDAIISLDIRNTDEEIIYNQTISILIYKQFIILKADDLFFERKNIISTKWQKFFDYINNKNITASVGIIGNSLDKGSDEYFSLIKSYYFSSNIEFWNHGYTHDNGSYENGELFSEFYNTPLNNQYEHLIKSQGLFKSKLKITSHTFGAPYDHTDQNTIKALNKINDIKVWFNGDLTSTKQIFRIGFEVERPAGVPNYAKFISNYNPEDNYFILQLHPNNWDEKMFNDFTKMIDFLINEESTFIKPYEYYLLLNK